MNTKLETARRNVSEHMAGILRSFNPGAKITVIVRRPGNDEADFLMTDDDLAEAAAVIARRAGQVRASEAPPYAGLRRAPVALEYPIMTQSTPAPAGLASLIAGKNDMVVTMLVRVNEEAPVATQFQARGSSSLEPIAFINRAIAALTAERDAYSQCPIHKLAGSSSTPAPPAGGAAEERGRLIEALTPSAGTKAAYHGEFAFDEPAGVSNAGIEWCRKVYVPWTTIKEIMAAILARAASEQEDC